MVSRSCGCPRAAPQDPSPNRLLPQSYSVLHAMRCKSGPRGVTDHYIVHTGQSTEGAYRALASCWWSGSSSRAVPAICLCISYRVCTTLLEGVHVLCEMGDNCRVQGTCSSPARHLEGQLAAQHASSLVMRRRGSGRSRDHTPYARRPRTKARTEGREQKDRGTRGEAPRQQHQQQ